ncbi:MAG: hypothetical protein DWQ10_18450, partial [Calditrichaeota bacterium]
GFVFAQNPTEVIIEGEFAAHASNIARFNSPITTSQNKIYLAYITPNLKTIVAQKNGQNWELSTVSQITQNNPYHNAPSIAVDENGYIHVLYNMHATPWQYSISAQPENISNWVFRGQYAGENPGFGSTNESECSGDCYDDWIGTGTADIPGNQIGYMFMANDRNGTIYVGFRECYDCDAGYHQRQRSGGIVRYDAASRQWRRVGGVRPWATDSVYSPLGIHFYFDRTNRMHVSWVWGQHYTEDESSDAFWYNPNYPCYAYSDDGGESFFSANGEKLSLPINFEESVPVIQPNWIQNPQENGYFWGYTEITAMPDGRPYVLIFPRSESKPEVRKSFVSYAQNWSTPRGLPWGGEDMVIDANGIITVISSGIRLHRSRDGGLTWKNYEIDMTGPYNIVVDYSFVQNSDDIRFLAFKQDGENSNVRVYTVKFTNDAKDVIPPSPPRNLKARGKN